MPLGLIPTTHHTSLVSLPTSKTTHHPPMDSSQHCSSSSLSNLFCQEDPTHISGDDDDPPHDHGIVTSTQPPICKETEDGYIELLLSKESSTSPNPSPEPFSNWTKHSRSASIQWILSMRDSFGFGDQTAYLAVTYFDRFLAHRTINEGEAWALRLLSVACLSLAAKMEELRPPALPEFCVGFEFRFDSITVQRMELLVLDTLDWRMSSVTPFSYLGYFATKLGVKDLVALATMYIFRNIEAMNLVDYRPSITAAAAILAASGGGLSKSSIESRISTISLPEILETEHVFAWYNLMVHGSDDDMVERSMTLVSSVTTIKSSASFTAATYKRRRKAKIGKEKGKALVKVEGKLTER